MKNYLRLFPALAVLGATALSAQQIAPAPATPVEETVELSPFTVTSTKPNDYMAAEVTTGSRVATSIRALPYAVNVVTSEFIKDFAAYDIAEQLAYTSGFSGRQQEGAYIIRGFFNGNQLRNGFRRAGMIDPSSVDRVEVIKGPAAAIYGPTSPGGTINIISKRPTLTPQQDVSVTAGSLGHFRTELSSSGPLGDTTAIGNSFYRVGGAYFERDFEQAFRHSQVKNITLGFLQKINANTSIFLEYDYIERNTRPGTGIPYLNNTATVNVVDARTGLPAVRTYTRNTGYAYELDRFSLQGPNEYLNRDMDTFSAFLEHKINHVFSIRAGGSSYNRHYYKLSMTGGTYNSTTRTFGTREPAYDVIDEWGDAGQLDLLARYNTDFITPATHSTLATFDYNYVGDFRPSYRWQAAALNTLPADVRNLSVDNPNYFIPAYDPTTYSRKSAHTASNTEIKGLFLRHNTNIFSERLKLLAAVRFDELDIEAKNLVTLVRSTAQRSATSPQFGVTFELNDAVSLYASRTKSFVSQTAVNRAGQILPNETGLGHEIGIKASMFDKKLNFTFSLYNVDRENVLVTSVTDTTPLLDTNGNPVIDTSTGRPILQNITDNTVEGGDRSRGIDFDFNYALTRNLLLLGDVTYIDAVVKDAGTDLDRLGRRPREAPAQSGGLALKYTFLDGGWKGLAFTGGVRYRGEVFPNNRSGNLDLNNDGLSETNNGQRDITVPAYTKVDIGASYNFRTGSKRRVQHFVQVNVKNLLDKTYYDEDAYLGDGLTVLGTYGIRF
ncbi:TonB-dependent siderophore receptor [Oleiharenicola lentus]|uniref:TonB-dependent siderophore receptor n=1 Tax=Oleiharenicola lentus TaxID=2508720 RepID=UPI003F668621